MKEMPFIDQLNHWATQNPERPAVIVGTDALNYSQLRSAAANHPLPARPGLSIINEVPGTSLVVQFCAAALQGHTAMVLDAGWPEPLQRRLCQLARIWDERQGPGQRPFLLGLSSGTSGTPKAFVRSAGSWRQSFGQSARYFSVTGATTTLAPGPLAASMNLYALGESLHAGGTFVALPQFSPDAALQAMTRHAVNRLVLVPAVLELIVRRGLATGMDGEGLEHIVCAGSSLSSGVAALAHRWAPRAFIQQYYGAAELGFVTAAQVGPTCHAQQAGPVGDGVGQGGEGQGRVGQNRVGQGGVGVPFPGVRLSIRDRAGEELATGELGLVSVKSPYVCDGYAWGDDGLAFTELGDGGWCTVHDRGSIDAQGVLHLAGRASDMILTSANNVYPHAVEEALQHGFDRCDVVVAGIPDELRGQRVVAGFHVARPCTADDVTAVMGTLRHNAARLQAAQRPTQYFELAELPLTGSGKTSRPLLAQWIVEGDARARRQG